MITELCVFCGSHHAPGSPCWTQADASILEEDRKRHQKILDEARVFRRAGALRITHQAALAAAAREAIDGLSDRDALVSLRELCDWRLRQRPQLTGDIV